MEMVKHWGGYNIALGLEIKEHFQAAINKYFQSGEKLPEAWFIHDPHYMGILNAARETQTEVVAIDQNQRIIRIGETPLSLEVGLDRNKHMADSVIQLLQRKSKILLLTGMEHAREAKWGGPTKKQSMGVRLSQAVGCGVYTIMTMTQMSHGMETFFQLMKTEFGSTRQSIAFDVDQSPLAHGKFVEMNQSTSWKDYCDGLILFFR
jgi:hypothetical protein